MSTGILAVFFIVILVVFHLLMNRNIHESSIRALKELEQTYSLENLYLGSETESERSGEAGAGTEASSDTAQVFAAVPDTSVSEDASWEAGHGEETETESTEESSDSASLLPSSGFESDDEGFNVAVSILVDQQYRTEFYVTENEKKLANWCRVHPFPDGVIREISVGKKSYYVLKMQDHYLSDDGKYKWILYVDITSQRHLVHLVEQAELLVMIICAVVSVFLGVRMGISLELEQEKQKQFFENASHELKTPLMSIQGYAEGIGNGVIDDPKKASRVILTETDKMRDLVEEILALSRLESSQTKLHMESVILPDIINDCLMALEYEIRKRGLDVSINLEQVKVQADPDQLGRVVMNLISNAVKYAESRIDISCGKNFLRIVNDGDILDEEEKRHIFDRFYIGKRGGTGIGLALVHEIVAQHGWRIRVDNTAQGVAFTITFGRGRR
ncbi:sensor histidine kinase [Porcincola intestinalis]|nr:HAMP domain-containing sensor histidine kinase [Porcincola intestinalis]